jgi:hypothetical protein
MNKLYISANITLFCTNGRNIAPNWLNVFALFIADYKLYLVPDDANDLANIVQKAVLKFE